MRFTDLSDEDLARRARKDSGAAFSELFERYRGPLWNYFLRQGVESGLAEDLFQTTFLKAFRAVRSFREEARFKTWLFTIAINVLMDERRHARRSKRIGPLAETAALIESRAIDELERGEELRQVQEALSRIEPRQRHLFTLVRFHQFSIQEAAQTVGFGLSAAKMTLTRVRKRLCESLVPVKESNR